MTPDEFKEYLAQLRDWKQDLHTLADCLETLWNAMSGGGLTAGDGISITGGVVSVLADPAASNGLTVGGAGVAAPKALTAGDGVTISGGAVAVKISADANNGASLSSTDKGVFAIKPS